MGAEQKETCHCYGCWFLGQGSCDSWTCSECLEEGTRLLKTEDMKDSGGAYRPCASCSEDHPNASE